MQHRFELFRDIPSLSITSWSHVTDGLGRRVKVRTSCPSSVDAASSVMVIVAVADGAAAVAVLLLPGVPPLLLVATVPDALSDEFGAGLL
jgi:hypothetical protein